MIDQMYVLIRLLRLRHLLALVKSWGRSSDRAILIKFYASIPLMKQKERKLVLREFLLAYDKRKKFKLTAEIASISSI